MENASYEPRMEVIASGRKFIRYRLLDFYPASLEKAVERIRADFRRPICLVRKGGRWVVKRRRFPFSYVVLRVDGEMVEVRGREGAAVFDEYCRRVRVQAPLRGLIRDLLFLEMMEREFGKREEMT